jgi:hypothetical protein
MSDLKTRIDYDALLDTGISLRIRLNTDPVTPREAEAFFGFLNRLLEVQFEAWEEAKGPLGIVPIIEVGSGSIHAIIRFMQEKTKDGKEFAREVAKDIAKHIAEGIFWALLASLPGNLNPPLKPEFLPQRVADCAQAVQPDIKNLYDVLEESGKPFTVEIFEGKIVIHGNEPKSTEPNQPFNKKAGKFNL